jgi:hypothetical protein
MSRDKLIKANMKKGEMVDRGACQQRKMDLFLTRD